MDNRAVTPVVEKLLTIGIVVLFTGSMTLVLFGSAVPDYRDAVGLELGERITVSAAEQVETAVPPNGSAVTGRTTIDLPKTIRGESYQLAVDGPKLVLEHPSPAIGGTVDLSLPGHVTTLEGALDSRGDGLVRFVDASDGLQIRMGDDG